MPRRRNDGHQLRVARVYDEPTGEGFRVLVDRLWPRGMAKERLQLDGWEKDIAPSPGLRRWYGHDPERFDEFARRYRRELALPPAADVAARLAAMLPGRAVVLLTATRDVDRSGAAVLAGHLPGLMSKAAAGTGAAAERGA